MYKDTYEKWRDLRGIDAETLKAALRHAAGGVTIVTTEADGERQGITVSSFTSISLDPPIIMISINTASPLADAILRSEHFAVHILTADQQELSNTFAQSIIGEQKYEAVRCTAGICGSPLFRDALAVLECALERSLVVGTHTVFFGRVVGATSQETPGAPLIYYHRAYRRLADEVRVED